MNLTSNDNYQLNDKPTIDEVEQYARELSSRFHNQDFFKWYCGVIHEFGTARVRELVGRVEGADYEGRLFSRLVDQERKRREKNRRLYGNDRR